MARKSVSELNELLKLLRRIVVLAVAAYGLAIEMPYVTLAVRLAILWAVLYIGSGLMDVVFRKLSYSAMLADRAKAEAENEETSKTPAVTPTK
jgi:hypothetical protein